MYLSHYENNCTFNLALKINLMKRKWTKLLLISSVFLICQNTFSQGIHFETGKWKSVVEKAKEEHKLIFLQLQSDACIQCNEVADQAFSNRTLGDYFNTRLVSIRLDGTKNQGAVLAKKYSVQGFPVSLFLDGDEHILSRYNGSTNNISQYINYVHLAVSREKEMPLSVFEKEYNAGTSTPLFLESYILKRNELNMPSDLLLEEYVTVIPRDSINSLRVLGFIFGQAPLVDSRAFEMVFSNHNIRKVYQNAGRDKTIEVNNKIIIRSLDKAIKLKDSSLERKVADFTKSTWPRGSIAGQKNSETQMLKYYLGTKEKDKYISAANIYYEQYYMPRNLDSLKIAARAALESALESAPGDTIRSGGRMLIRKKLMSSSRIYEYGNSLNTGAWNFYKMTENKENLQRALTWIQRAIAYREDPSYVDTYAHLLYKLGQKEEAIKEEEKAIELVNIQRRGVGVERYKDALDKMKKNELTPGEW